MSIWTILIIVGIALIACVITIDIRSKKAIKEKKSAERAARKKQNKKKKKAK